MTKTANTDKELKKKLKAEKKAAKKAMYPEYNAGRKKVLMYYGIAIAVVIAIGITLAILTYTDVISWTDQQALWRDNRAK